MQGRFLTHWYRWDIQAVSRRRVSILAKSSQECDERLRKTIRNSSKVVADHELWGQFLDDDSNQVGVYGTSAAICIMATDEQLRPRCKQSLMVLPGIEDGQTSAVVNGAVPSDGGMQQLPPVGASGLDKSDLNLTLKCTAILDAAVAVTGDLILAAEVIGVLKSGFLENRGWGYETTANCTIAEVIPTARVLISTSSLGTLELGSERLAALGWLSGQITDRSDLTALERAFGLTALRVNQGFAEEEMGKSGYTRVENAISTASKELQQWCGDRTPILVKYYEHIHYVSHDSVRLSPNGNPKPQGRYMFYPVDAVVALALITDNLPFSIRRYVRRVVDAICLNVRKNQAYKSAATGRMAIADAQICHDLLTRFRSEAHAQNAFKSTGLYFDSMSRVARAGVLLVLTVVTALAAWVGIVAPVPQGMVLVLRICAVVVGGIAGSILARFLARLIFGM